jgi:pSer/pThr/pTyr-binding forkhead associated (FHA) protein
LLVPVVRESRVKRRKEEVEARKREEEERRKAHKRRKLLLITVLGAVFLFGMLILISLFRSNGLQDAETKYSRALLSEYRGDYDEALSKLTIPLSEFNTWSGDGATIVEVRVERGKIYTLSKNYDKGEQDLKQALEEATVSPPLAAQQGRAHESLASLHEAKGDVATATTENATAIEEYNAVGDFLSVARILEGKANREEEDGQLDLANVDYRQAFKNYQISGDPKGVTRTNQAIERTRIWGYFVDLKQGKVSETRGNYYKICRDVPEDNIKNDLSFSDTYVSRRHVQIAQEGPRIEDFRSLNGTAVNAGFIPYGHTQLLQDGDIITLANTEVLRFTTTKTEQPTVPSNAWAIFIDGKSRTYSYLTDSLYSLVETPDGLTAKEGDAPSALVKLRHQDNKPPEAIGIDSRWAICVKGKMDDYRYGQHVLNPNEMKSLFNVPARLIDKKKSTGSERAANKPASPEQTNCEGPPFQIVLFSNYEFRR